MTISAVILAKNASQTLQKCLQSLTWCDEIVIIDDNSNDNTLDIAKKSGAKIFSHPLDNNFSSQRNFGLEKTTGEWVLFVDADEIVTDGLRNEILHCVQNDKLDGVLIQRIDYMWGKEIKHGEMGSIQLLRLARKNAGHWEGKVHEVWRINGKIGQLNNELLHYPHPTVSEFLQEINFYTTLRAKELFEEKVEVKLFDIIAYPKAKFIQDYFIKCGFLDGLPGFILALFMSFHSFLVRAKLWQYYHQKS
jgi:glycosyltransferase involved in cell wall biosynthesis